MYVSTGWLKIKCPSGRNEIYRQLIEVVRVSKLSHSCTLLKPLDWRRYCK